MTDEFQKKLEKLEAEFEIDEMDKLFYESEEDNVPEEPDDNDIDDIAEDYRAAEEALSDEEPETVMDAEEDEAEESDISLAEAEYAKTMLSLCEGVDEENNNRADIALHLYTRDVSEPDEDSTRTIAHAAFSSPVLTFNRRNNFIEVVMKFPTATDKDLAVIYSYLKRYGDMLNELTDTSTVLPFLAMHVVPREALGANFVLFFDPVFWNLSSTRPGELPTEIRMLFESNDIVDSVEFYETDEISLEDIEADAQREIEAQMEVYAEAEADEAEKKAQRARMNKVLEDIRKGR